MTELEKLIQKVEKIINEEMDKFAVLAKKAKQLLQQVDTIYTEMASIYEVVKPADYIVRAQNKDLCPLFDELERIKTLKGLKDGK